MKTIVFASFWRSLACNVTWASRNSSLIAWYRWLLNCQNQQHLSETHVKLLMTAFRFRPGKRQKGCPELGRKPRQRLERNYNLTDAQKKELQNEIKALCLKHFTELEAEIGKSITRDSIRIDRKVMGYELPDAIQETTGLTRSTHALEDYAKILSQRTGREIVFKRLGEYEADEATAFAQLCWELHQNMRMGGRKGGRKSVETRKSRCVA